MEETIEKQEPKLRVNLKRNFKGEYGWEITAKGDTEEEVRQSIKSGKIILAGEMDAIQETG